jgi:hypothetical protein
MVARLEVVVMVLLSDGSFVEGCGKGGVRWVLKAALRTG